MEFNRSGSADVRRPLAFMIPVYDPLSHDYTVLLHELRP